MTPQVLPLSADAPDPAVLKQAADVIRSGGLVVFPTETVYGLAADAVNPEAIERLNRLKGRPPDKPYSLHLHSLAQLRELVPQVPALAQRLMERFWPGPITIVIPSQNGGLMGFRLPDHPVALAFLQACERPVVAPSANHSGSPPPTDAQEVLQGLQSGFELLLDCGPTRLGRESSVVQVIGDQVEVLREGAVSREAILTSLHE